MPIVVLIRASKASGSLLVLRSVIDLHLHKQVGTTNLALPFGGHWLDPAFAPVLDDGGTDGRGRRVYGRQVEDRVDPVLAVRR